MVEKIEKSLELLWLLEVPACGGVFIIAMLVLRLLSLIYDVGNFSLLFIIVVLGVTYSCNMVPTVLVELRANVQLYVERKLNFVSIIILAVFSLIVSLIGRIIGGCAIWVLYAHAILFGLAYIAHLVMALRLLHLLRK